MTLFLLSLAGFPPTAGFFGKFYVILAAIEAGGPLTFLAVLAVLNAAAAAFYYLRVVVYMYMRPAAEGEPEGVTSPVLSVALAVAVVAVVVLGIGSEPVASLARAAAALVR